MLNLILEKLKTLKELDTEYKVFGADSHQYNFNPEITEDELMQFEKKNRIKLPKDYRNFIKTIGNGGCGPDFGLFKLKTGIYDIPFNKKQSEIINLEKEFKFIDFWNLEEFPKDDYDIWLDEYDNIKWTNGMLRINHLGSGKYSNLIISGKEKGNIWIDSRTNEGGIYPSNNYNTALKNDFLSWYLYWVESSIIQLKVNKL
jgi:hypothetical protein